jgi:hypothetical protein
MGGNNYVISIFYIYIYTLFIFFPLFLYHKNHPINIGILYILLPILFFPPTPFFLFFYYNSFFELDTENKQIKVRKLLGKYKTINLNGNERYIIRRIRGRLNFTFVYVISDEKVLFSYQSIFNSNWGEFEEGLNNMGIGEVSYDGMILFRDLFKMRL